MPRILAAILLVAVLAIGGGLIATTAYQAGLGTAITTATGSAARPSTPVVVPAYGYGYGPGWHPAASASASSASSARLFFLFIVFALIRAIFWRGGPGRSRRLGPRRLGRLRLRQGPGGSSARGRATPTRRSTTGTAVPTSDRSPVDPSRRRRPRRRRPPAPPDGPRSPTPRAPGHSSGGASRSTMRPMKTILVVDDEPKIATLARDYLEHAGFAVLTADDGPSALDDDPPAPARPGRPRPRACPGSTASTSPASCAATRRSRS